MHIVKSKVTKYVHTLIQQQTGLISINQVYKICKFRVDIITKLNFTLW